MRASILSAAILAAAASLGLAACVVIADGNGGPRDFRVHNAFDGNFEGVPERLLAASVEPGGLRVRAASNGCTSAESFGVSVDDADGRYRVTLERDIPDRCGAPVAEGVELFFPRERLGLAADAAIELANPVGG